MCKRIIYLKPQGLTHMITATVKSGDTWHSCLDFQVRGVAAQAFGAPCCLCCSGKPLTLESLGSCSGSKYPSCGTLDYLPNLSKLLKNTLAQSCQGDEGIEDSGAQSLVSRSCAKSKPINIATEDLPPPAGSCSSQKYSQSLVMVTRMLAVTRCSLGQGDTSLLL